MGAPGGAALSGAGEGALVERLVAAVGSEHVLVDPQLRAGYERDITGRFSGWALAVVRPATTAEVEAVLAACSEHATPVVAQGGNTGLVGGGVPRRGEVVLSLRRLDWVGEPDTTAGALSAGAGATLSVLQRAARAGGWDLGVDFAARDSATLGGAIATNAGGSRVLRFGPMRDQLLAIEAVTAAGRRVGSALPGSLKESSGPHLPGLLAGSEGTLAVVTAARLRLVPRFTQLATALATFGSPHDIAPAVGQLRR